jgi:L-amino acid N-acyltransferase YncA
MRFAVDTNIAIALDPLAPEELEGGTSSAVDLVRLAVEGGHTLFVHPASDADVERDPDTSRREARRLLLRKYPTLNAPPEVPTGIESLVGSPAVNSNDWVDNQLLATVLGDAVDYLVTEDDGIHRKARRLAQQARVITIADAVLLLESLSKEFVPLPRVEEEVAYQIDAADPILQSVREEYGATFDGWLETAKRDHRPALVIRDANGSLEALAILKHDDDEFGLGGRVLKLSTFKVGEEHRGNRYGELLLHAVLRYARQKGFDAVWVSVFDRHEVLISLFEDFGFARTDYKKQPEERVYAKRLSWTDEEKSRMDAYEFHVSFGPPVVKLADDDVYVVPIQPTYHRALFPEGEDPPPLVVEAFGNALRKAYLSNAPVRRIGRGALLLFYRSHDEQAVTAVGVVEDVLMSRDPLAIQHFVGNRTVYTEAQIEELCTSEVLVILFRFDRMLDVPITLVALIERGLLSAHPQTITQARPGGIQWLREILEG